MYPHYQILLCLATGTAVSGIFPFIFIPRGSGVRLDWLDTIGVKGKEAYSSLTAAVREGELELPKYITVIEPSGNRVHLGTSLTQPTRKGVLAALELEEKETVVVVRCVGSTGD
jgi:hypothetical protein